MQLLVSVVSAGEALAAVAGGADIVDAKDPGRGALGAVSIDVLRDIQTAVAGTRPVSAAIGDAADEASIERAAFAFAAAGAMFVKVGFAGIASLERVTSLADAAKRGVVSAGTASGLVVVAYADADSSRTITPAVLVDAAAGIGARGVLLDTLDKNGPGLRALIDQRALTAWVARAHDCGLVVALAGKLAIDDLAFVRDAGADIAGVRGAACEGGRTGRVTMEKVQALTLQGASRLSL